jgi:hypothetical protein
MSAPVMSDHYKSGAPFLFDILNLSIHVVPPSALSFLKAVICVLFLKTKPDAHKRNDRIIVL